jgi:universal stress protein E
VLTVRRAERPFRLSNVLVGVDFGPASNVALACGRSLCRTFGRALHLLHATENYFLRSIVSDPRPEERLTDLLTEDDSSSLRANPIVEVSDAPAEAILDYATRNAIDLIIVGAQGQRTMKQLLMGSVAERIVRTGPCPVLTVHHQDRHLVKRGVLAAKMRAMMTADSDGQRRLGASA